MSAGTKAALEEAINAHFKDEAAEEGNEDRASAVLIDWVVGYTISNIVNGDVGYANGYDSCDTNPNAQAHLARWVSTRLSGMLEGYEDDDDD